MNARKRPIPARNRKTTRSDSPDRLGSAASAPLESAADRRASVDSHRVDSRFDFRWLIGIGLVALTLTVYAQVWNFEFIHFDDHVYTDQNPHVAAGLSWSGVIWAFRAFYQANWIPLTWISLMIDASLFGNWPGGYHLTNVLLHTANVLLLFYFVGRATKQWGPAAMVAALFAVHPIHVESVAWVTERKDVLSLFFGLLSLTFYVRYAETRKVLALVGAFVAFAGSLLAKPALVTLPFVFLLLDVWPLARFGKERVRTLLVEKVPFFALSIGSCLVTVAAQTSGTMNEVAPAPLALRVANALLAYVAYVGKGILPLWLGVLYPFETEVSLPAIAAAAAIVLGITALTLSLWRRLPFLAVGWLWFLGTLVPMIGVIKVGRQQLADRYAYFPFIGLYLAVVWLAMTLVPSRKLRVLLAVVALAFYSALGFIQVGYWRDGLTLAEHTSAVTTNNWFCHYLLGMELSSTGHLEEAVAALEQGVRVAPHEPETYTRLGDLRIQMGRNAEAVRAYRFALADRDDAVDARSGLGWAYLQEKKFKDAKREFARALEVDPKLANLHFSMAYACRLNGDYEESNRYCQSCLALEPDRTACLRMMADNLDSLGRRADAEQIRKSLPARTEPSAAPAGPPTAHP